MRLGQNPDLEVQVRTFWSIWTLNLDLDHWDSDFLGEPRPRPKVREIDQKSEPGSKRFDLSQPFIRV
jgi:hypothetical protein